MSNEPAHSNALAITEDESTLAAIAATKNDLAMMTEKERAKLYGAVCRSIGLNPLTAPFEYIKLNGKLTLYAKKGATDQIRDIKRISITKIEKEVQDGVLMVTATAQDASGRTDSDMGAVVLTGLKGENLANAHMKAITKAKRRVTLSMAGLGFLDETEIETIPASRAATVKVDHQTGEIHEPNYSNGGSIADAVEDAYYANGNPSPVQPQKEAKPTPPQKPVFYDPTKEDNPELRKKALASFNIALKEAGMDEGHRHALAWGAGYEGSSRNVPTLVLKQWTSAMKAKPGAWKKRAEELMKDYQSVQEEMNFEAEREAEYDDTYEGEYVEVTE